MILTAYSTSYKSHIAEDIVSRLCNESSYMNMDFTPEIYQEAVIKFEDLVLEIANRVVNQLEMTSTNRSVVALFDVELNQ